MTARSGTVPLEHIVTGGEADTVACLIGRDHVQSFVVC